MNNTTSRYESLIAICRKLQRLSDSTQLIGEILFREIFSTETISRQKMVFIYSLLSLLIGFTIVLPASPNIGIGGMNFIVRSNELFFATLFIGGVFLLASFYFSAKRDMVRNDYFQKKSVSLAAPHAVAAFLAEREFNSYLLIYTNEHANSLNKWLEAHKKVDGLEKEIEVKLTNSEEDTNSLFESLEQERLALDLCEEQLSTAQHFDFQLYEEYSEKKEVFGRIFEMYGKQKKYYRNYIWFEFVFPLALGSASVITCFSRAVFG